FHLTGPSSYTFNMLQEKNLAGRIQSLALKSEETVEFPPIQLTSAQVTAEFEEDLVDRAELIAILQRGSVLDPVRESRQQTIFSVDGPTKNFWIKVLHSRGDVSRIERVHIIGVTRRGSKTQHTELD